jgi:hypothetical protein
MKIEKFLETAWTDHALKSEDVAASFPAAFEWIESSAHITQLAALVTHVYGEHLGQWQAGIERLEVLGKHVANSADSRQAVARSISALKLAGSGVLSAGFSDSDLARILSVAAAARVGHGEFEGVTAWLRQANALCEMLPKDDPAHRALAITANNLAAALEEKENPSKGDIETMLLSARLALESWLIAGQWGQHMWAHHRMAKSLLKAGHAIEALEHAQKSLDLCVANMAEPYDLFWANECLCAGELASGDMTRFHERYAITQTLFNQLSDENKKHCAKALQTLRESVSIN